MIFIEFHLRGSAFILSISYTAFFLALMILNSMICFLAGKREYLYRKDFENPPPDLTPAEAMYALSGDIENKVVISLLYYWAQEGYLRFFEQRDNLMLTKEKDLPVKARNYEKQFFYSIFNDFGNGSAVSIKDLQGKLFGLVFRIQSDIKNSVNKKDRRSSRLRLLILTLATVISTIPYMFFFSRIGIALAGDLSFKGWLISFAVGIFFALPNSFYAFLIKKWLQDGSENNITNTVWGGIMFLTATLILNFIGGMNGVPESDLLIASIFALILSAQLGLIRRKTPAMHHIYQQVRGFRNYLSGARKEEASDPQLFYQYLPYAMVFDTGYQWGSKFEGLVKESPFWYQGYAKIPCQPQEFARYLEAQHKIITQNMVSPPIPKGSIMIEAQQ